MSTTVAAPEWVGRNEDKPHRCPSCHGVAVRAWSDRGYSPRSVLHCPRSCGLRWRAGVRTPRTSMRWNMRYAKESS